jgi:hypothetical protein
VDLAALRSLAREVNFAIHGIPAEVTPQPPTDETVSTRIIWLTPVTSPQPPGSSLGRSEARRTMAIRRDDVPSVPMGTQIAVTEHLQAAPSLWKVDGTEAIFHDHVRVVVVPAE